MRATFVVIAALIGALLVPAPASASTDVAAAKTADVALRGVSTAGAEFTSISTPVFDTAATFEYLASRGYTLVRIPFRWESMQRTLSGPLDAAAVAALRTAVDAAGAAGLRVVLDVHNYAMYGQVAYGAAGSFTEADFADLWSRLSLLFRDDPTVMGYGLMNEPRALPTVDGVSGNIRWQHAQQAALDAIRANGDVTCVLVSGYSAGAMGAWLNATNGQPTPYIHDPADNIRWEAHHYWDANHSGKYATSYADAVAGGFGTSQGDAARTRTWFELDQWLRWLKDNHQKGFIGEFGWPSAQNGTDAAQWDSLAQMYLARIDEEDPSLVWTSAWATGARWSTGYPLQYYAATGGVLSTPLSNAATLEAFAREVAPAAAPAVEPVEASTSSTEQSAVESTVPRLETAPATQIPAPTGTIVKRVVRHGRVVRVRVALSDSSTHRVRIRWHGRVIGRASGHGRVVVTLTRAVPRHAKLAAAIVG